MQALVERSGVRQGLLVAVGQHATTALVLNENEERLLRVKRHRKLSHRFALKVLSPIGVATGLVISSVCVPFPADRITPSSRSARAVRHSLMRRSFERN